MTSNAQEVCSSPEVDVVVVCNANGYHPLHTILALKHDKYVMVEKPVALCLRDIDAIIEAEKTSKGRVFVGYQRRYAPAFLDAVKEVGSMEKIQYARVRDIIGPNAAFVSQSGTFPQRFTDFRPEDSEEMAKLEKEMIEQGLVKEMGLEADAANTRLMRLLGGLGTHDLSAMREILGMPKKVLGAYLAFPMWTVTFEYEGFPVVYESGINNVPVFDAHIEIYSADKIVRVNYDTPYIKGLPVTMTVRERHGDGFAEHCIRQTYEDPYTLEFLELHRCVVAGETPKTSAEDARKDNELFEMILRAKGN